MADANVAPVGSGYQEQRHFIVSANWRAEPPVIMDIGPVLHADDVAGKVSALYHRAEPRDCLDIDADMLATIDRYADRRFTAYGITPDAAADLRSRIADWREEIRQNPGESPRTVVRSP
jgi:hypothetical protein